VEPDHDPGPLARPPSGRWEALTARIRPWIDWFGLGRIVTTAVTVVLGVVGGWWLLRAPDPSTEAGLPVATAPSSTTTSPTTPSSTTSTTPTGRVVVHVAGAVARPGVYELASGDRVHAALDAAGGSLPEAATDALNLAAPLADGERVYVPVVGESVPPPPDPAPAGASSPPAPAGPVDLNRATAAELDLLPGIGPATAQAIVDHRQANGPFASVDDLEAVRGIGPAKLEAIRPLVTA
jgi:competence protein ComEA